MPNMETIIASHNRQVLEESNSGPGNCDVKLCNCRKPDMCPLQNKCLVEALVYKAIVTTDGEVKVYIGSTGDTFKHRFSNHVQSFKNIKRQHETKLSSYIWSIRDKEYKIEWTIVLPT